MSEEDNIEDPAGVEESPKRGKTGVGINSVFQFIIHYFLVFFFNRSFLINLDLCQM